MARFICVLVALVVCFCFLNPNRAEAQQSSCTNSEGCAPWQVCEDHLCKDAKRCSDSADCPSGEWCSVSVCVKCNALAKCIKPAPPKARRHGTHRPRQKKVVVPPPKDGADGKDGKDGKDGADGKDGGIGPVGPQGKDASPAELRLKLNETFVAHDAADHRSLVTDVTLVVDWEKLRVEVGGSFMAGEGITPAVNDRWGGGVVAKIGGAPDPRVELLALATWTRYSYNGTASWRVTRASLGLEVNYLPLAAMFPDFRGKIWFINGRVAAAYSYGRGQLFPNGNWEVEWGFGTGIQIPLTGYR